MPAYFRRTFQVVKQFIGYDIPEDKAILKNKNRSNDTQIMYFTWSILTLKTENYELKITKQKHCDMLSSVDLQKVPWWLGKNLAC